MEIKEEVTYYTSYKLSIEIIIPQLWTSWGEPIAFYIRYSLFFIRYSIHHTLPYVQDICESFWARALIYGRLTGAEEYVVWLTSEKQNWNNFMRIMPLFTFGIL